MSYSGTDLADMDPGEEKSFSLTFVPVSGTVVSVSWGITSIGGLDPYAASKLAAGSLSGAVASNKVSLLVPGIKYLIIAQATLSTGDVISLYTHVFCRMPT